MRPTETTFQALVHAVLKTLKEHRLIEFKVDEKIVIERAVQALRENYDTEARIESDAKKMVADLERQNAGAFDRHRMFTMVKQRLAKERKFTL